MGVGTTLITETNWFLRFSVNINMTMVHNDHIFIFKIVWFCT